MREEKISLIKKACFMLNFLNLKSFPLNLFFCSSIQPQHTVRCRLIATLFLMSGKCKYTYVEVTALINSDGSKK